MEMTAVERREMSGAGRKKTRLYEMMLAAEVAESHGRILRAKYNREAARILAIYRACCPSDQIGVDDPRSSWIVDEIAEVWGLESAKRVPYIAKQWRMSETEARECVRRIMRGKK